MRGLETANQLTSFVFHPINYLWYDFDRDGSETWAMPTQPFFSSGKRQRLYFTLSYIKMCPSKWGWWKIALSTLLPHVYVTNCVYPHVGECVNVLFLLRGIVHAVATGPVTRSSVSVSIIELKFLQSMSGSVTNQRKVNNVQPRLVAGCGTSPCWPISRHNQSWLTNGGRDRGVGCCHGAPTFLSRPSPVHVCDTVVTCHDWRILSEDMSL